VADDVITPSLQALQREANTLHDAVQSQCKESTRIDRELLQARWKKLMQAWMRVEPFAFGPVIANNRDFKIHFWPIRKSKAALLFDQSYTAEQMNEFSVAGRGLAGLEYVLFDNKLTVSDIQRCRYLSQVSAQLLADTAAIEADWPAYAQKMKVIKSDNPYFLASQDVINLLFGKLIQHSEGILKRKLAVPIGIKTKGKPKPYKSESWRSGNSLSNLQANLDSYDALLAESAWVGFQDNEQASKVHSGVKALQGHIAEAREAIDQAGMPWSKLVQQDNDKAMGIYSAFKQVANDWKAIARALNVSQGFNDNDGD
jgi:predicted lipoprotein